MLGNQPDTRETAQLARNDHTFGIKSHPQGKGCVHVATAVFGI